MIEHIVLFRCNDACTPKARQDFVIAARALKESIPEILYLSAGINWSDRGDGYELALVGRFQDKESMEVYQKHSIHQKFVAEHVRPNVEKVVAIDYFIE